MLWQELSWDKPVDFDVVRDLCRRFGTPLLPTAQRVVWLSSENTALVRSRRGEESECLRRNDVLLEDWLRKQPAMLQSALRRSGWTSSIQ